MMRSCIIKGEIMSEKEVKYDEDGIVILDDEPTPSADYTRTKSSRYEYNGEPDFEAENAGFKIYNLGKMGRFAGAAITILLFALLFLIGFILLKIVGFIVWYFFPIILVYIVWKLYLHR